MHDAIKKEKFREDLYYRLSTIEINLPPLRQRKDDIHLLFRKFASDFALKYKMPTIKLDDHAIALLTKNRWNGNVRQLRNVAEQLSVLEENRLVDAVTLKDYLPNISDNLPAIVSNNKSESEFNNEREILYKVLFDMKNDLNDLKRVTKELMGDKHQEIDNEKVINHFIEKPAISIKEEVKEKEEETLLTLQEQEKILIEKALQRHQGRRKDAAEELGISERTLYRKIKEYLL